MNFACVCKELGSGLICIILNRGIFSGGFASGWVGQQIIENISVDV